MNRSLLAIVLILTIWISKLQAQSITNYAFSTGTTASLLRTDGSLIDNVDMTSGTTLLLGVSESNTQCALTPIGFDFYIYGTRQTEFNVTSNGNIGIGSFASPGLGWLSVNALRIAPFLGTTNTSMGTSSNGRIHYKVVGTAPFRVGVIEFLNMAVNSSVVNDSTTFQVRLYEINGAIEFVYGRMAVSAGVPLSFYVGFHTSSSDIHSVNISNHTSSTSSSNLNTFNSNGLITQLNSSSNGNRRFYRWIPAPPNSPSNFIASIISNNSITLTWNDASNEIAYVLYRSVDSVNYAFRNLLPVNTTTITDTGLATNTTYYYRLASLRESIGMFQNLSVKTLLPNKIVTTGSGNWSNPSTWFGGILPTISDSTEILSGHTVTIDTNASAGVLEVTGTLVYSNSLSPTLDINSNLIIRSGGNFNAGTGTATNLTLNIGRTANNNVSANLVVNGSFDMATTALVTTNFLGTQNASITGTGPLCDFGNLTINKGNSNVPILDVLRTITMLTSSSGNSRLNITAGTLKISSALTITPFPGNANFIPIGKDGHLWLANASANVFTTTSTGGTSWRISGRLTIDNGTLRLGSGAQQGIIDTTSVVRLNGGNLNINGSFALQNFATCSLVMNGGNLTIDPQASSNLNSAIAILNIPAAASLIWNAGDITIVDPHNTAGGTSVLISAGGNKIFSGGKLSLGNGISTSGGGTGNTAGFGLNITTPIHNIDINNNTNTAPSRMARLLANLTVTSSMEIRSNSYIFLGSGATGATLQLNGSLTNNGTIGGSEPTGTQVLGTLSFNGSGFGTQFVSGNGSTYNTHTLVVNNTSTAATSVAFNNSTPGVMSFVRVNLRRGVLNRGSNFTVGFTGNPGTVQFGGLDELTTSGRFNAAPVYVGTPSFIYGPTSSACTTGAFNELPAGAMTAASITINDAEGLTANRNINATSLSLSGGNLNMGTNGLTLGVSAAIPGTLSRTSGFISLSTGTFTRWYGTATITSDYVNGFPIISNGNERSVLVASSGVLAAGGSISVQHININGNTDIPAFTDGGVSINRRSNSNWIISASGIDLGSSNLTVTIRSQGMGAITNVTDLRMIRVNNGSNGTWLAGSGTNLFPEVNRQFSQANITASQLNDTFYYGADAGTNPLSPVVIAVANGSWGAASTWDINAVPADTNSVLIPNGFVVSVPSGTAYTCRDLSISPTGALNANNNTLNINGSLALSGILNIGGGTLNVSGVANGGLNVAAATGSLTISSGVLNIGAAGGSNRTLNVAGVLTVSGGTLNINGNLAVAAGASFAQSGGNINVDGNAGSAATSVPSGTALVAFNSNTLNCSAGTITIVDPPHHSYTAGSTHSLRINAFSSTSCFTGTHTIRLGDGVSVETGNTDGFCLDTRLSGVVPIRNLEVNGGSTTGRWASTSFNSGTFGLHLTGNLTINSNSEFRHNNNCQLAIGGNIINNGTMTSAFPLTLGGIGYSVTNPKDISGTGIFRNNITGSTGSFTSVTLANGTGLTLSTANNNFTFTGTLTLDSFNVFANSNTVTIASGGSLLRSTGYIVGRLGMHFTIGSNISRTFAIGTITNYLPVTFTFPSVSSAGILTLSMNSNDHPQISTSCFNASKTINRNWSVSGTVLPVAYNATLNYLSSEADPTLNTSNARAQTYNGSAWQGSFTGSVGATSASINNLTTIGDIQLGEFTNVPVSVSIAAGSTNICQGTSVTFTATPINGGATPTFQWKKNGSNVGSNSSTYSDNGFSNGDQITCEITSSLLCAASPNATSNTITMSVTPQTVSGTVSGGGSPVCSGSSGPGLTLGGNTGNVLRWQSAIAPYTSWSNITNTTTSLNTGTLTQSTAFRAVVQNSTCNILNSDSVVVTVSSPTIAGSVSGGTTICSGATSGTLTLSGNTGSVVRWESSVAPFTTWTTISNTATTYTSGALTQTTQFRAVVQSGTCPEANSTTTTVTVSPTSVGGSVSGGAGICTGSTSGTLTLSGNTGSVVRWESSVAPFTTWTTISNTATTYTSGALTQTTQFRAVVQSGTCPEVTSTTATVTVSSPTVGGSISGSTPVCSGTTSNLTLSGQTGSVVRWESATAPYSSWSAISNTTTSLTTSAITQPTAFRAVVQSGSCAQLNTDSFVVNVISSGVWLGSVNSNWNNASNWCGGIPTTSSDVVINSGAPNAPSINTAATVNNLTINSGGSLSFSGTGNSIDIRGTLTQTGSFNKSNGTVIFGGLSAQNIPSDTYTNLTISGGSTKTPSGVITVNGTLSLSSGYIALGSQSLVVGSAGSITGASATSFVIINGTGRLTQNNIGTGGRTGSIQFPVGTTTTSYTPVSINNSGTADDIAVGVINGAYPGYTGQTPTGIAYSSNVVDKTWFISEATAGGSNASVTFQWNGTDELSMNRSNMLAGRYSTSWNSIATGSATGSGPYTFTANNVSTFGTFGLGDNNSSLPVSFISFTGAKLGKDAILNWSTAQEINNSHFEVERSLDGITFKAIGKVTGRGNTSEEQQYSYTDANIFAANRMVYYRLKQVDFDGTTAYTSVVAVMSDQAAVFEVLQVSPNPFISGFTVGLIVPTQQVIKVELTDAFGKLISTQEINPELGMNNLEINESELKAGMYIVRITQGEISKHIRVVKQQ